ncbi:unnamed protein product [Trichobilharzia regenti]|nr:unnamed protein product [Trichobilharzia regenti]
MSLDEHAKRKFLRLAIGPGPGRNIASYDWNTDILKLTTGRCPTSKQNTDFLTYVLTVLTLESKLESHPTIVQYREALKTIWAKNDILNGDQWVKRRDPPRCRHGRLRPIRDVPFITIPGADDQSTLEKYASATRNLFGLKEGVVGSGQSNVQQTSRA